MLLPVVSYKTAQEGTRHLLGFYTHDRLRRTSLLVLLTSPTVFSSPKRSLSNRTANRKLPIAALLHRLVDIVSAGKVRVIALRLVAHTAVGALVIVDRSFATNTSALWKAPISSVIRSVAPEGLPDCR